MRRILRNLVAGVMGVVMCSAVFLPVAFPEQVLAARKCGGVETNVIDCPDDQEDDKQGGAIFALLNLLLTILTYGVGIAATIGMVISGYVYLTARDNEGQVVKAKMRILQIVIGLVAYAVMWTFLQFLLPGGLFGTGVIIS